MRRAIASLIVCGACLSLQACSLSLPKPPKPWEKGALAKPEMSMGGDALEQRFSEHIASSKAAASGGFGVGGGGCGCN